MIFNCSVWQDIEWLKRYVYSNVELKSIMRRRKEWFEPSRFHMALWWIVPGHILTVEKAQQKLMRLAERSAFNYAHCFNAHSERI